MARERMVTRTVKVTRIEVLCLDIETANPEINIYELTGTYTEEKALKKAKETYETQTLKLVSVNRIEEKEKLYGMRELDFIKYAVEMDSRFEKID